ncbi:HTH domain-containing protein [Primorskyibacter sp. 2E107]|uniref:HTH domain-containing protein n=1 Tax=Primorskyibacter sp. 2E107 TaxID=3403458 RepID=UPI003AF64317
MAQMPWKQAIITVLSEADEAVHYKTIAEEIESKKLRTSLGATPANSVYTTIGNSLKNDGEETPFVKVQKGLFAVKDALKSRSDLYEHDVETEVDEKRIVKCVGMFWHQTRVIWRKNPRLLGQQQTGSKVIDFNDQRGVYLLHDRSRVIYVGRSIDRPLGQRLYEHTKDRLNGRWDRFSWFGLCGVDNSGRILDPDFTANLPNLISLMEAVLIESLEPPQNRKRGDDFSDIEYLQVADSEKSDLKKKAILDLLTREISESD